MVDAKKFSLVGGSIMLSLGILAIAFPGMPGGGMPPLYINISYGYFLGVVIMNIVSKIILIIAGLIGLNSYFKKIDTPITPIMWSKMIYYFMGTLALLGVSGRGATLGGYCPVTGNAILFYAALAALGGYFGYIVEKIEPPHTEHGQHKGAAKI